MRHMTTVSPALAATAHAFKANVSFSGLLLVAKTTTMSGTVAAGLRSPITPCCRAMTLLPATRVVEGWAASSRAVMAAR